MTYVDNLLKEGRKMCGIVGYMGDNDAVSYLLDGLERLEYRGYDSAGIAVNMGDKLALVKSVGRIKNLEDKLEQQLQKLSGHIGIGHTRWATHGKPTEINAHPHSSESKSFVVVHNGIIENYIQLKKDLVSKGKKFVSDTDTEVIAQLLEYNYNGDFLQTVSQTLKQLRGSYALGILSKYDPDKLIVAKKASPLIIGISDKETFVASDVAAFISKTKRVLRLQDGEMALITSDAVTLYDEGMNIISRECDILDFDVEDAEKGEYEYFMLKEIHEQPKALRNTILPRIKDNGIKLKGFDMSAEDLKKIKRFHIIGCGSAYHVGCIAKYIFEKYLRKHTEVDLASEFRYKDPIVDDGTLLISISQSGETADTLAALKEGKRLGAKTLSIVNVEGSTIANESDYVLYTHAGPEIAVATTKAYSAQLAVVYMLTIYFSKMMNIIDANEYTQYVHELIELPDKIAETIKISENVDVLANKYYNAKDVFFIGRNIDYTSSLEGSLKLKEISYIHSEAYAAGELKHGTISLIDEGMLVISLCTLKQLAEKTVSNIREVKARGAVVISLICEDLQGEIQSDELITVPRVNDMFLPSVTIIPLQLLAYNIALKKECNVDKPKNLAKSVTVE